MDIAIVTGAEGGFGLSVARRLIQTGCRVYGLSWDFSQTDYTHNDFRPLACDLADPNAVAEAVEKILEVEGSLFAVIHCAQLMPANPLESAEVEEIQNALHVGLLCPMVLIRKALPALMKTHGYVVTLGWNGRGVSTGGAAGSAVLGGLHRLGEALFEEVRDTGLKVTTIIPQPNLGKPDAIAQFRSEPQSVVDPERIADVVEQVVKFRENNGLTEVVVQPMGEREDPVVPKTITRLPQVKEEFALPPRSLYPEEPEPIRTPDRQRPDDAPPAEDIESWEDELDEEMLLDDDALMEKYIRRGGDADDEDTEDVSEKKGRGPKTAAKDKKESQKSKQPKGPAKLQLKVRGPAPRVQRSRNEDWPGRRGAPLEGSIIEEITSEADDRDQAEAQDSSRRRNFAFETGRDDYEADAAEEDTDNEEAGDAYDDGDDAEPISVVVNESKETTEEASQQKRGGRRRRRNAVRQPPGGLGSGPSRHDLE
ncbi:MAG: SDR family oxidoreductase [Opitutales bacterium]